MKRQKFKDNRNYIDLVELARNSWRFHPYDCDDSLTTATAIPLVAASRSMSSNSKSTAKSTSRRFSTQRPAVWVTCLNSSLLPTSKRPPRMADVIAVTHQTCLPDSMPSSAVSVKPKAVSPSCFTDSMPSSSVSVPPEREQLPSLPGSMPSSCVSVKPKRVNSRLRKAILSSCTRVKPILPSTTRLKFISASSMKLKRKPTIALLAKPSRASRLTSHSRRTVRSRPSTWVNRVDNATLPGTSKSSKLHIYKSCLSTNKKSSVRETPSPQIENEVVAANRWEKLSISSRTRYTSRHSLLYHSPRWINRVKSSIIPLPRKRKRRGMQLPEPVESYSRECLSRRSVHTQYEPFSQMSVATRVSFVEDNDERDSDVATSATCSNTRHVCGADDCSQTSTVGVLSNASGQIVQHASTQSDFSDNQNLDIVDLLELEQRDSDVDDRRLADADERSTNTADNSENDGDSQNAISEVELGEPAVEPEVDAEAETAAHTDEEAGGDGHHNNNSVIEIEITLTSGNDTNSDDEDDEDDDVVAAVAADGEESDT